MPNTYITDDGVAIHLASPETPPECQFVGRERELRLCRAALGLTPDGKFDTQMTPLHFRLEGPPGVGKNEIVYQLARQMAVSMQLPFYSIQGHEEMTPEDLSILTVPDPEGQGFMPFRLQASPLATALLEGGLFFFDEISRVPERALTPLASVLDRRRALYSATTGLTLRPSEEAAKRFRFVCALNPGVGQVGTRGLPDYIDERTLPVIKVGHPDIADLRQILERNVTLDEEMLNGFVEWYQSAVISEMSVRQAISLLVYTMRTLSDGEPKREAFARAARNILRPEQAQTL